MKLISHRGNTTGPEPLRENSLAFIQEAIDKGYDVEIDVRVADGPPRRGHPTAGLLYLGHDGPDYLVHLPWLIDRRDRLWIHAKNFRALSFLIGQGLMVFYHQLEKHTIIGNTGLIWSHDISEASEKSVIPLLSMEDIEKNEGIETKFHGVCSDYVEALA